MSHPPTHRAGPFLLFLSSIISTISLVESSTFSYGTVMSQEPLPLCALQVACNGEFCADICEDGTVVIDPFIAHAIRYQYNLSSDRSWKWGPILGTHNAFIARSNGFGLTEEFAASLYARTSNNTDDTHVRIPNQRYGPTTLLDFGVRELEFDIWDISWDIGKENFDIYMCHSPVPDPNSVVALQEAANALGLGALSYDPFFELCSNHTFAWANQQVQAWLAEPENTDQVVALFLDNRVAVWNIDLVSQILSSVWQTTKQGRMLMTPNDVATLFNNTFPSRNQMLAHGFHVYCESNSYVGNNYTNTSLADICFYPTTWAAEQIDADTISPFPNCTIRGDSGWYGTQFTRILDGGDLAWSPAEEEGESGIIYKAAGITDLVNCGFNNIGAADLTPAAIAGFVWSWAPGEPRSIGMRQVGSEWEKKIQERRRDRRRRHSRQKGMKKRGEVIIQHTDDLMMGGGGGGDEDNGANCSAGAITLVRGQWTEQPCSNTYVAVCRKGDNTIPAGDRPDLWMLTPTAVTFQQAPSACAAVGNGWVFDVPRDGRENQLLVQRAVFQGLFSSAWEGGEEEEEEEGAKGNGWQGQGQGPGIWVNAPVQG